ncbi:MAG TPA: sigma-54 dependent transcriptional regulator [Nitrospinota bacterium]|nr:sigma-54 dependent transcriptional regulator [Nitrospinota bacterium]
MKVNKVGIPSHANNAEMFFRHTPILIVDDEPNHVKLLTAYLRDIGCSNLIGVSSPQEALALAKETQFELAIIDYRMEKINGLKLIRKLQESHPKAYFILISAFAELETSIDMLSLKIFDCIQKPISQHDVELLLARVFKHMELSNSNEKLKELLLDAESKDNQILGQSLALQEVKEKIRLFAKHYEPVFITGETGVGKELVAKALHNASHRSNNEFVAVNCNAYPDTLLESELFGYEKGAFTGATSNRRGKLEHVGNGTILLDEVCDIPPNTQVKLLRVLQEREFERIGGNTTVEMLGRIVSATNKDFDESIKNGWLRQDFYYRINRLHIHIPPLRDRVQDIEYLALNFFKKYCLLHNKSSLTLSDESVNFLMTHQLPGNVRQLQSVIDYGVLCCEDSQLQLKHFPGTFLNEKKSLRQKLDAVPTRNKPIRNVTSALESQEKELIIEALELNKWNRSKAAEQLGFTKTQMFYRLKKYKL